MSALRKSSKYILANKRHYRLKLLKLQREASQASSCSTVRSGENEQKINAPPVYQASMLVKSDAEDDCTESQTSSVVVVQETDAMNTESEL